VPGDLDPREAALFGCAVMTGVGAVLNTAGVPEGSSVAVFGLGGVGLSAVMGAHVAGAAEILAVDIRPDKLSTAAELGATDVINGAEQDAVAAIRERTGGGAAYVIEASGIEAVCQQAYDATRRGGETIYAGLPDPSKRLSIPPVQLVAEERTVRGSYMGSAVPDRDIPRYVELYRAGRLPVDRLLSGELTLETLNEGFDVLDRGAAVRQVLVFDG